MPKKIGGGSHYNFIFFLNHVLHKTRKISGEPTRPYEYFLKFFYSNLLDLSMFFESTITIMLALILFWKHKLGYFSYIKTISN
jgi:hypothetical protein